MSARHYHVNVEVTPAYIADQSNPDNDQYVFAYTVTIRNDGDMPARLVTRHWVITDGDGEVQEVRGEGVVGEKPHLMPGEGFQYTSGTMMKTPVGTMQGSYQMIADDGGNFDAEIPSFSLAVPNILH